LRGDKRYDALNRLAFVDDNTTGTVRTSSYSYNPNGSLERVTYANGIAHQYSYDALNRPRYLDARHPLLVLLRRSYLQSPTT
jgi:hypothetical protein